MCLPQILPPSHLSSGEGDGTPLQYSCLENPMDRGAWQAAVHGVARSRTRLSNFTFMHWRRKWQPTPVFLPGESQGRGSLVGCCLWGRTELDTTEATQQQQQHLSSCGRKRERMSSISLFRKMVMSWGLHPHDVITSQRPHLLGPSHWRLGFQHINLCGDI